MMLSVLTGPAVAPLVELAAERWRERLAEEPDGEIHLADESARILCAAVCEWAGVPFSTPTSSAAPRPVRRD